MPPRLLVSPKHPPSSDGVTLEPSCPGRILFFWQPPVTTRAGVHGPSQYCYSEGCIACACVHSSQPLAGHNPTQPAPGPRAAGCRRLDQPPSAASCSPVPETKDRSMPCHLLRPMRPLEWALVRSEQRTGLGPRGGSPAARVGPQGRPSRLAGRGLNPRQARRVIRK